MTVLRGLGVTLPVDEGLTAGQYLDLARLAEEHGYTDVLVGEVAGPEVFSMLGMIAASTSRIRLGSGIVGVYPRTAVLTAMGFTTLASLAPGRVLAGLGASSPIIVEQWHGLGFDAPRARIEEYVATMRTIFRGERTDIDGEHVRSHGFRAGLEPRGRPDRARRDEPADAAPRRRDRRRRLPDLDPARRVRAEDRPGPRGRARGRPRPRRGRHRRVVLGLRRRPRRRGARADAPLRAAVRDGADAPAVVPREPRPVSTAPPTPGLRGDREAALRAVDDDAVAAMCALGTGDDVAARVAALREAGVDLPIALTPGAVPGDAEGPAQTIARVADAAAVRS